MRYQEGKKFIIPICASVLYAVVIQANFVISSENKGASLQTATVDISQGLPDDVVFVGKVFKFSLASHELFGKDFLEIQVREVDKKALPDWIVYNHTTRTLTGVPTSRDTGDIFIEVLGTCKENVLSCQDVSDVFRLSVKYAAFGAPGTPSRTESKSVKENTEPNVDLPSLSIDDQGCGDDVVVVASLVLCVGIEGLDTQHKVEMLTNMADFLSLPVWRLTIMPSSGQKLRAVERGYQIVSAGAGPSGVCDRDKNVELTWRLSCSTVKHLKDFVKVLQHNLNVGRVEKEVAQPVVGWYVASSNSLQTVQKRRRRQAGFRTPVPTPVLQPVTPDVIYETIERHQIISSSPPVPEKSKYIPDVMTRQVPVDESSPFLYSSQDSDAKHTPTWEIYDVTPSYPLFDSSEAFLTTSQAKNQVQESIETSGESDSFESSQRRVIITSRSVVEPSQTSSRSLRPSISSQYTRSNFGSSYDPDIFDTSFSGSGSSADDFFPSVINTRPSTRTFGFPDSSSVLHLVTPTRMADYLSDDFFMFMSDDYFQTSVSVIEKASDMHLLELSRDGFKKSSPVYSQITTSSETSGDTSLFIYPEQLIPVSSPIFFSSKKYMSAYTSHVVVPTRSFEFSSSYWSSSKLTEEMYPSGVHRPVYSSVTYFDDVSSSSYESQMSSAVYLPTVGSGSGSGSGSGDGVIREPETSQPYTSVTLPGPTGDTTEVSGSGVMGSGDNATHTDVSTMMSEINHPPVVVTPLVGRISVPLGVLWEYPVPNDVFFDDEDGDVTNLELSLSFLDGLRVPPQYWLQVDKNRRMLTGLLTTGDLDISQRELLLVATDTGGLSAKTVIHLEFETPSTMMQTHKFEMAFAMDYDEFMSNKQANLDRLLQKISSFFGDDDSRYIRVLDIKRGSLILSWNNSTLNGMDCSNDSIEGVFTKMRKGGTLQSDFIKHMQPEFHPLFVDFELLGSCAPTVGTTSPITPTEPEISPEEQNTLLPVYIDRKESQIFPSSATDQIFATGIGSGLATEDYLPVLTSSMDTSSTRWGTMDTSLWGSGGLWTPTPGQTSVSNPSLSVTSVQSSPSSVFMPPKATRPDYVWTTTDAGSTTELMVKTTTETTTKQKQQMSTTEEMKTSTERRTIPWIETWTFPTRPSTQVVDTPPFLENPVDYINANLGKYLVYKIPRGVFYDREDGDTRSLQLSLTLLNGQALPQNFWLQLDARKQVITGLPLLVDLDISYHRITLVATDSHKQSVKDAIKLYVNSSSFVRFTHKFIMTFTMDFTNFMNDRTNLNELLKRVSSYFGDSSPDNMVVMDVTRGSLVLTWSNVTLNGDVCYNKTIHKLYKKMVRKGNMVRPAFNRFLSPDYELKDIGFELDGACIQTATTTETIPSTESSTTDSSSGLSIWAQVVLPVMIALLIILLILLVVLLINKKRKRQSALQNSEKPVFTNDRNPVIFPEEMEGNEMGLKPKKPMVLPNDRNQSASSSPRTTYYFEDEPHSDHGSNYGTGSRTGSGRRHPKPPPPYYQPHSDPPPYRLPPPYLNTSSDV